ncbi:MAG: DUF5916 domain-containing protein, partial [Bacteroidales bacterium]
DKDYARLDTTRTSLIGSGGRIQIVKNNGHLNLMGVVIWKTPGFEINDLGYMQSADQILSVAWAGYNLWEPKGIYRSMNINADIYTVRNFGGDNLGNGFEYNLNINLKNYWNAWAGGNFSTNSFDNSILRGGPLMKTPGRMNARVGFSTDDRKKMSLSFYTSYNTAYKNNESNLYSEVSLSYKPVNYLSVSLGPGYTKSFSELQYVTQAKFNDNDRYVFASIDRKTLNASLRIDFNLNPELTVQYWGQPFIATGKYYNYKYITDPLAEKFTSRFNGYTEPQVLRGEETFGIDENSDGLSDFSFDTPDFKFGQFLSNLVVRWEYSPGSTVYLVWSQTRSSSDSSGTMDYFNDMGNLFSRNDNVPNNVFLIKFSYRFGLK